MSCNDSSCGCDHPDRRDFLKIVGASTLLALHPSARGDDAPEPPHDQLVPPDKHLDPEWLRSLTARGDRTIYRGKDLAKIGMPVGGLCAGQLYLGGDGKLWHWDIFNQHIGTGDAHYAHPPDPDYPIDQGFAVRVTQNGNSQVRTLDKAGFSDIRFTGEYPIGYVAYTDEQCPVTVALQAFSPFIPLNTFDSSLPATVMEFTVKNVSGEKVGVDVLGWIENAVCLHSRHEVAGIRRNRMAVLPGGGTVLLCEAEPAPPAAAREPITFETFEGNDWGKWKVEGTAFGEGPSRTPGHDQRLSGFVGNALANSYPDSDQPQGKLTSPSFRIDRPYISFLIGGGNHPGKTCINLVVDEKVIRTATGRNSDAMVWHNWEVGELAGTEGRIEIVDAESGGWGHIEIDQIQFGDAPMGSRPIHRQPDFGTMALAIIRPDDIRNVKVGMGLPASDAPQTAFDAGVLQAFGKDSPGPKTVPLPESLRGALSQHVVLEPGKEASVTFLIAWNFPNLPHPADPNLTVGNYYAKHLKDAEQVTSYVADHYDRLSRETKLWHDTWYDSTLPYWALDRTLLNASILATSTCRRWRDGRFWCWEGVGCCIGTCTHVWHYAHAAARLFPELERSTRELQDLDTGFDPSTGSIGMRGEFERLSATDGQTGTILRFLREHQTSPDDQFLNRNWPRIKKAIEFVVRQDGNDDGILEGDQPNTLDTSYFGPSAMISSLYLAAARAGEQMAGEVGDTAFAQRLHKIVETGSRRICDLLFNGEYFIQLPDPKHPDALKTGPGCFIDQVFGQSWAWQVDLGRILPQDKTLSALKSLWKYNFAPDVGPWRAAHKPGRWYAMPGEAGLIMCTWPRGGYEQSKGKVNPGFAAYLNECMNGFEYQVAGHMIWEGMLTEGLAITRALHDRYHASKRNPWNEIECGDHYARSMASYGVFLALCGFAYHGPSGTLAFAPRLTPENFRAPFTAAEGWGTYEQTRDAAGLRARVRVVWGNLRLRSLRVELANDAEPVSVRLAVNAKPVECSSSGKAPEWTVVASESVDLAAGDVAELTVRQGPS